MVAEQPLPGIARITFAVHLVVAVIFGLMLLLIPMTLGEWLDYPFVPEIQPVLRAFGAMILGFGGLTSLYGLLAKSWERVAYIVHGEVTYLALQTLVFLISTLSGVGPALAGWLLTIISAVLLVLFLATFFARPR